jgi:hypothetical protein
LFAITSLGLGACTSDDDDDGPEWVDGKADGQQSLFYNKIVSANQFQALALKDGGVVIQGPSMKFLIDRRHADKPKIYFQNANFKDHGKTPDSARYHYFFGEAVLPDFEEDLGTFNHETYEVQDKRFVAGTVQTYKLDPDGPPLYGFQFYPEDVATEGTILSAMQVVKKAFQIPNAKLAFVATGPQQKTATVNTKLKDLGLDNTTVDQILGSLTFLPLNMGEAWG